jgi:tight adherence protein B
MAAVAPYAILLAGVAAIGLVFASFSEPLFARIGNLGQRFDADLELAGMRIEPRHFAFVLAGVALVVWLLVVVLFHPGPLVAIVALAASAGLTAMGGPWYLRRRRAKRIAQFSEQLEGALRTLAGGVRVGLGIRQALVLTAEQSQEPSRSEFTRVIGLTSLGIGILDGFDQLAARMTNTETAVLARVIRVQSQTGGDLASVLENLAGTIRDRRRLRRRVKAVTAQGRATAWLLGLLPIGIGMFVLTQDELRQSMLFTLIGQIFLGIAVGLDAIAVVVLLRITRIDP